MTNNLVTYQNRFYNTSQPVLHEKLICQRRRQKQHIRGRRSSLEAHSLLSILYNHPLAAAVGKTFTYALYASSLHAQLHELMSQLCGFSLNFTAKAHNKGDDLSFNFLKQR